MVKLLDAITTTQSGPTVRVDQVHRTFQATVAGSGAVSATVIIEGSNDGTNFLTLGTFALSGTMTATDGGVSVAKWDYVRARLTAISGTGAAVTVLMGV